MCNKNKIRVALVDDHDLTREIICNFLNLFVFQLIFEAENGKVALEKMKACETIPDVCIVDVNMPGMNGFETVKALRINYPRLRILVFTTNDDEKTLIKTIVCGANGYVLKNPAQTS